MPVSHEGCLDRPGRQKTAGATLYLMEELGDARLRCDQLLRYLQEAVQLIEKSSHKDHFFEVAGHLIQSIPDVAFRLQKALQAVALAADRIDYEELKQDLRPEKVDELERVLKEVRIRPVQHRSFPPIPGVGGAPMTPKSAIEKIRHLAKTAREEGSLPLYEIAALIRDLDPKRTANTAAPVADTLDRIALHMEQTGDGAISRKDLATMLSRLAMEAEFDTALRQASKPKLTQEMMQFADVGEVKKKFKAENPDISDADLNEIAKQWQQNKDVVKDKSADAADGMSGFEEHFETIRQQAITAARHANVFRWRPALLSLYNIVDEIGTILVKLGSMDTQKSEGLKREIKQVLPQAARAIEDMAPMSVMAGEWKASTEAEEEAKRSRFEEGKPADPTENMSPEDAKKWKTEHDNNKDNFKAAEDKRTKFEEGKPADPTENMSPEDAKKWKTEHDKNKDNFKSAASWKA